MKIRISGNFLRFRLSKTEVSFFGVNGTIEEKICFGKQPEESLMYALEKSQATNVSVSFRINKITVLIPQRVAENWVEGGEIGFEGSQKIDDKTEIRILVEKDFAFLKPKKEDDSDNYPHPLKSSVEI